MDASGRAEDGLLRYGRRIRALAAVEELRRVRVDGDVLAPLVAWIDTNYPQPKVALRD